MNLVAPKYLGSSVPFPGINNPFSICFSSPARVHSSGRSGHGHPLPGQVRHGQDRGLRSGHPAAAGTR
jgi:hypothetical protein